MLSAMALMLTAASPTLSDMVARMGFPAARDGFVRETADVAPSADYALVTYHKAPGISLELGLVQILDMSPKEHYWVRRAELLRGKAAPQPISEGDYKLESSSPTTGYWGKFTVGQAADRQIAAVITFDFGVWDVHVRAEYPAANARASERQIRLFLRSLPWDRLK